MKRLFLLNIPAEESNVKKLTRLERFKKEVDAEIRKTKRAIKAEEENNPNQKDLLDEIDEQSKTNGSAH